MVGACINVAISKDYSAVWTGKAPADFATDIARLQADYGSTVGKAALAEGAVGGAGDAKSAAETVLEYSAYVLARALANHFKKLGDLDRLGKVDVSKTEIVKLRAQDLVSRSTEIRDLASAAQSETDADKRGVTPARIAELTAAITGYTKVMSLPRGQIVNRSTLLKELETDVAALLEQLDDMDDLVLQFAVTEAGSRFLEAWKRARIIVDSGGGGAPQPTPPVPTPAPAHA